MVQKTGIGGGLLYEPDDAAGLTAAWREATPRLFRSDRMARDTAEHIYACSAR